MYTCTPNIHTETHVHRALHLKIAEMLNLPESSSYRDSPTPRFWSLGVQCGGRGGGAGWRREPVCPWGQVCRERTSAVRTRDSQTVAGGQRRSRVRGVGGDWSLVTNLLGSVLCTLWLYNLKRTERTSEGRNCTPWFEQPARWMSRVSY
jgi:hypothetical protein